MGLILNSLIPIVLSGFLQCWSNDMTIFLFKARRKCFLLPSRGGSLYWASFLCLCMILSLGHLLLKCIQDEYLPQGAPLIGPPAWAWALFPGHFPQQPSTSEGAAFYVSHEYGESASSFPLWPLSYWVDFNCLPGLFKLMMEALSKSWKRGQMDLSWKCTVP